MTFCEHPDRSGGRVALHDLDPHSQSSTRTTLSFCSTARRSTKFELNGTKIIVWTPHPSKCTHFKSGSGLMGRCRLSNGTSTGRSSMSCRMDELGVPAISYLRRVNMAALKRTTDKAYMYSWVNAGTLKDKLRPPEMHSRDELVPCR